MQVIGIEHALEILGRRDTPGNRLATVADLRQRRAYITREGWHDLEDWVTGEVTRTWCPMRISRDDVEALAAAQMRAFLATGSGQMSLPLEDSAGAI